MRLFHSAFDMPPLTVKVLSRAIANSSSAATLNPSSYKSLRKSFIAFTSLRPRFAGLFTCQFGRCPVRSRAVPSEDRALYKTLNDLTYSIYLLTDEIEAFREKYETVDDLLDNEIEFDDTDNQQHNADAQNQKSDF